MTRDVDGRGDVGDKNSWLVCNWNDYGKMVSAASAADDEWQKREEGGRYDADDKHKNNNNNNKTNDTTNNTDDDDDSRIFIKDYLYLISIGTNRNAIYE